MFGVMWEAHFSQLKKTFLNNVVATVNMEEPAELIINWDQTGIKIVPYSKWPMVEHGAKCVEMFGVDDKHDCFLWIFDGQFSSYPS